MIKHQLKMAFQKVLVTLDVHSIILLRLGLNMTKKLSQYL